MARTQSPHGGNPQASGLAAGRGLLIVVIAVAVGVLLLARATEPERAATATESADTATSVSANGKPAPTSAAAAATTSTIAPKKEPQNVVVLVANGRGVAGAAKANADALRVLNYNLLSPTDYPTVESATTVYFQPGFQADAIAIATSLKIDVARVTPLPATPLPLDVKNSNVIVVLGTDGQGLMPS